MNKIKILIIIVIAVIGALLIYNHFENTNNNKILVNKFSKEYKLVDENNIYKYSTIDEILRLFESGTGVVFFCTPESKWCQKYAYYLNEALKENGVEEINYLNIKEYRELNTSKYQKILDYLEPYIYKDDEDNRKLFMPDLTVINSGIIVGHNNDTSLIESDANPEEYWTDTVVNKFRKNMKEYIIKMNEDLILDDVEDIE